MACSVSVFCCTLEPSMVICTVGAESSLLLAAASACTGSKDVSPKWSTYSPAGVLPFSRATLTVPLSTPPAHFSSGTSSVEVVELVFSLESCCLTVSTMLPDTAVPPSASGR